MQLCAHHMYANNEAKQESVSSKSVALIIASCCIPIDRLVDVGRDSSDTEGLSS